MNRAILKRLVDDNQAMEMLRAVADDLDARARSQPLKKDNQYETLVHVAEIEGGSYRMREFFGELLRLAGEKV